MEFSQSFTHSSYRKGDESARFSTKDVNKSELEKELGKKERDLKLKDVQI